MSHLSLFPERAIWISEAPEALRSLLGLNANAMGFLALLRSLT
jgi:hypothetical protein